MISSHVYSAKWKIHTDVGREEGWNGRFTRQTIISARSLPLTRVPEIKAFKGRPVLVTSQTILWSINESQSFAGKTLRHGKGRQEFDWQCKVWRFLYRLAQMDRRSGRLPIRDQIGAWSYVRGVRSRDEGVERDCSRAHGEGKAEYVNPISLPRDNSISRREWNEQANKTGNEM